MNYTEEYISTLADHMEYVLGVVVDTFGQAGIALPELRYITFGQPVHDCEQVTVQFQQMYVGPPGDQAQVAQPCDSLRSAALLVEIVRCVPTPNSRGGAPTPEQLTATARTQAVDAYMLM